MNRKLKYVIVFLLALLGGALGSFLYPLTQMAFSSPSPTSDTVEAVNKIRNAVVTIPIYAKIPDGYTEKEVEEKGLVVKDDWYIAGQGSGIIYKKTNNKAYIVTNAHVTNSDEIQETVKLGVILASGESISCKLVGEDLLTDLAVLEIDSRYVTDVCEFANSNDVKVGETAIAIGAPINTRLANTVTRGIVSNKNIPRELELSGETSFVNAIQTDAAINPGNSGGPLVNSKGQVIGINEQKMAGNDEITIEGIGYAIPSNVVVAITKKLEKNGKVIRPTLGINTNDLKNLDQKNRKQYKIPKALRSGVVITKIKDGSPVGNVLKKGDVIINVNETPITSSASFKATVSLYDKGDTLIFTIYRSGKEEKLTVHL